MRHRRHDEIDYLFRKFVASAEFRIPTLIRMKKNLVNYTRENTQIQLGLQGKNNRTASYVIRITQSWPSLLRKTLAGRFMAPRV